MTVAKFVQPDRTDVAQTGTIYPANIDAAVAVMKQIGAAFAPHAADTPDMSIKVDAGIIFSNGDFTSRAQQSVTLDAAHATLPRIDRVVISQAGGLISKVTGTPNASPTAPAIPSGYLPVGQVLVEAAVTVITDSKITDERAWLPSSHAFLSDDTSATGPIRILDRHSASPAADDGIGCDEYRGRNSSGGVVAYALTRAEIADPTAGAEDGRWSVWVNIGGGSLGRRMYVESGMVVGSPGAGDLGSGKINAGVGVYANGAGFIKSVNAVKIDHSQSEGNTIFLAPGSGSGSGFQVITASSDNFSTALATCWVGRNSSTLRSINAGGTVNASGADYAEYETKREDCGLIEKGDIVGFDEKGLLTDIYDLSVAFGVKSTNPCYVGGDTWGSAEVLEHKQPNPPEKLNQARTPEQIEKFKKSPEYEKYLRDLDDHLLEMETRRQRVDRIAYSGKTPVNHYGAHPGDFIIPARQANGRIGSIAVTQPTFEQYRMAVGQVRRILDDGRSEIVVKPI